MSHYATISIKALEDVTVPMVKEALHRINKKYSVELLKNLPGVPSFGKNNAALLLDGTPTNVRFNFEQKEGGKLSLSIGGEAYRSSVDANKLAKDLSLRYSEVKIEHIVKEQNMMPVKREVKENGDIVMRFALAA